MSTPTTSRLITEATASLSLSTSSSPKLTSSIAAAPKTPSTLSPLLGANSGIGGISMSHSVSHSSCLDLAASSIENQKSKGVVEPYADAVTPLQFPKPVIPGPIPNNYSINYNNSSSSSSTKYSNNFDHSVLKPSPTLLASTTIPTSVNIPASSSSLPPALQEEEHDYVRLILTARVYDACIESPLHFAPKLSEKLGNLCYLKREDLQPVFSFKCRGAYNKMCRLTKDEMMRGVVCVSAGNHAQGVALAANKLGIKATIVMPQNAPDIKVDNVRRMGANVVLYGNDFDEAKAECMRLKELNNLTFIHPFDDPYIIAGQGTVGVEILRQLRQDRLDAIFVCCGGGGLISGIAAYVKRIRPETKVIGVSTIDSDAMHQSLQRGNIVTLKTAGLFSDGTSIKVVGKETFRLCQQLVDDFVLVSNDELCSAIKDTFDETRTVLEPAGALAVAGMKRFLNSNTSMKNGVFVAITSGANMNFDRLRFVAERARIGEGREVLMSAIIPERPGSLLKLYELVFPRTVTEFSYRFNDPERAVIFMAVDVKSSKDADEVFHRIKTDDHSISVLDITNNEMAKSHARFLIGGRSNKAKSEVLLRFSFPERPGALLSFLSQLESTRLWNCSLFHYRNHGSDIARVLVGLQLEKEDGKPDLFNFLNNLGYTYIDESKNPVYESFLK